MNPFGNRHIFRQSIFFSIYSYITGANASPIFTLLFQYSKIIFLFGDFSPPKDLLFLNKRLLIPNTLLSPLDLQSTKYSHLRLIKFAILNIFNNKKGEIYAIFRYIRFRDKIYLFLLPNLYLPRMDSFKDLSSS